MCVYMCVYICVYMCVLYVCVLYYMCIIYVRNICNVCIIYVCNIYVCIIYVTCVLYNMCVEFRFTGRLKTNLKASTKTRTFSTQKTFPIFQYISNDTHSYDHSFAIHHCISSQVSQYRNTEEKSYSIG